MERKYVDVADCLLMFVHTCLSQRFLEAVAEAVADIFPVEEIVFREFETQKFQVCRIVTLVRGSFIK